MYNLFVTFTEGAWERGAYEYPRSRAIGGYGDQDMADSYKDLTAESVTALKAFPCLFVYEEGVADDAYVGWLTAIKPRSSTVRVELEIDTALPRLSRDAISKLSIELDIGRFALSHTHWAVKDVDLVPTLMKAGLLNEENLRQSGEDSKVVRYGLAKPVSELHIRPSIFRIPSGRLEHDLVAAMMPFEGSFTGVFKAIDVACKEQSLRCLRADNIWDEAEVIQDIFSMIYRSRIVVCDFSGRNPNVFYEAGIAHTLGKTVIPIVQHADDIPFDLRHIRFIKYLNNREGRETLRLDLSAKLERLIKA